ncbi:DUF5107 domain-containing protein [Bailinhaonella thermotolerans]|uniref:DUF5107 domain-containing protein n=1 Tax=Bailinhaonella thermotolerans TaxID=1070861 RepID=A0A3A4AS27_9ACTN|nr:DUF5107 domain-containing protein [Bailinhaonella thermotolerans]RJL30094.1 DUF5107 domain-containing protein [Bailinhaonella thermotolerans]
MTTLRLDTLRLPGAGAPAASPLPILHGTDVTPGLTGADEEMTRQIAYGQPATLLPYTMQDGYTRAREERELPAVVLENELLTATFLPGYGGRLWSLAHRPSGRELLHRNPVLQPANLALRDAWLAGGVEWNLGATGHWPLTCAPLHAVRLSLADGTPVLRMFEFERLRRLVVRIDAWLPAGSPVLFVRPAIVNPGDAEVPVYWWSNIAVPEAADVRVVAPAERAYHFDYGSRLRLVDFPELDGVDRSYPDRVRGAADYFFEIPAGRRRWVAALDGAGRGLAQVSTDPLRGRKLFHWGTGPGGLRWQEWLSGPGSRYLEVQAGLARTQLEHIPMPGGAEWSWVEAYGLVEADPAAVHGTWDEARAAVGEAVDRLVPASALDSAALPPDVAGELLARGSGWGALEALAGALPSGDLFGDVTEEQRPWAELVKDGRLPVCDPPAAPVTGPGWRARLEDHPADWHSRYHLGLVRYADGDAAGAREAWEESLRLRRTPWALRCLAEASRLAGDGPRADLLTEAHALLPGVWQLTSETLRALLSEGRAEEALALVDALDPAQRALGRIRLLEARAAVAAGDVARAGALLDEGIEVDNLREGEDSLDELWYAYHERRLAAGGEVTPEIAARARRENPLPREYDFRMNP